MKGVQDVMMRARKTIYILALIINAIVAVYWSAIMATLAWDDGFFLQDGTVMTDLMLFAVPVASILAVVALWWKPWQT